MEYTGHTIVDGVLKYASVSAVKMFDRESKGGCPRHWAYRYVFGKKDADFDAGREAKDKGISLDGKLKNFLRTGDKALPALALKGLHILETPGDDLWVDLKLHRVKYFLNGRPYEKPPDLERHPKEVEVVVESGLTAAGVPFIGEIDYAHARGHFRNDDGEFEEEPPNTVEVCDIKFKTSAKDRHGNSTFMHEADLVRDVQMAGYGEWFRHVRPQTENVRLSLLYYPENKGLPTKVTRLHVIQDCAKTWQRIEGVVANMKEVAREKNIENVPYSASACHAWGASESKRCPHAEYCTAYERTAIDSLYNKIATDFVKEPDVGLLASNPQMMQNAPQQQAPAAQPDMRAQLAAEEQQMRQQVQQQQQLSLTDAMQRIGSFGFGTPTLGGNAAQAYAAAGGQSIAPGVQYAGIPAPAGAPRSLHGIVLGEVQHVFQILGELEAERTKNAPPQVPPQTQPAPQAVVQQAPMQQPQNFTQQVAQAYNAQVPPQQQVQYGGGGSGQGIVSSVSFLPPDAPQSQPQLAQQQAAPAQQPPVQQSAPPAPQGQGTAAEPPKGPGRPRKKKDETPAPQAPVDPNQNAAQGSFVQQPAQVEQTRAAGSCCILINARNLFKETKSLDGYVDYINQKLARMYNTTKDGKPGPLDVRMAVDGSILGFGGWKGGVREAVKADPPPEGDYHLDTHMDDLREAVADGLRMAAEAKGWMYVRGVR